MPENLLTTEATWWQSGVQHCPQERSKWQPWSANASRLTGYNHIKVRLIYLLITEPNLSCLLIHSLSSRLIMFPLRLVTATVLTGVAIAVPSTLCSRDSTAANVSTPAAACQDSSFFTQLVDHNDTTSSNATFLQQYELITEYYAPGGPILFYQGAEESNMTCLVGSRTIFSVDHNSL